MAEKDPRYGEAFYHSYYPFEPQKKAVELYQSGKYTGDAIAKELNIGSIAVVLNWVHKVEEPGYDGIIPKRRNAAMPKPKPPDIPEDLEALRQRCEELEINIAILRETIEILKKTQASTQGT